MVIQRTALPVTVQQFTLHRHRLWKANGKGLVVLVLVLCHSYEAQLAGFHYRT